MAFHHPSNCERHADEVLMMASIGMSLTKIAAAVKTNRRHVKAFLKKRGVMRSFPYGSPGAKHPGWKGGRLVDDQGYVRLHRPDHPFANRAGYVLEHRLAMEMKLKRYLRREEVVHHRNGKTGDNRPENLQLFSTNAKHLQKTIRGRVPKWTEQGVRRMKEGIARSAKKRRPETRIRSGQDVQAWQ